MGGKRIPEALWIHGQQRTYARGCRCDNCRTAHNKYQSEWRRRNPRSYKKSAAKARAVRKKKELSPEVWMDAYEYLDVARPDFHRWSILEGYEDDLDWIRRQLESRQTIWASQCPKAGRTVSIEAVIEATIEGKMQDAAFRKTVLRWKGVIK